VGAGGRVKVRHALEVLGVAGLLHPVGRGGDLDLGQVAGGEPDTGGAEILLQPCQPCQPAVPGMGTIQGRWASSQASAICAGVVPLRWAMAASRSTRAWLVFRFSSSKQGMEARMSVLVNAVS